MRQTEYAILGLLSDSPLTGYEIKRLIDVRFRFFWNESFGQLYPALRSMASEGLISDLPMDEDSKRARKRVQKRYRITPAGLEALQQWIRIPVAKESIRLEILLKMYFSNLVEKDVMMNHILRFQESHEKDLMVLGMFERELRPIVDRDLNHAQVLRVIDFGQKVNEAYLNWSRETLLFLERKNDK